MKDPNADFKKFITQTVAQVVLESEHRLKRDFLTAITAAVAESEQRLENRLTSKLESFRDELQTEMRAGFAAMDEAFDNLARIRDQDRDYIEKTFIRHDREITILQKQIAPTPNL